MPTHRTTAPSTAMDDTMSKTAPNASSPPGGSRPATDSTPTSRHNSSSSRPVSPSKPLLRWNRLAKSISAPSHSKSSPAGGSCKSADESMIQSALRTHISPMCTDNKSPKHEFIKELQKHGLSTSTDPRLDRMAKELAEEDGSVSIDRLVEIAGTGGHIVLDALSGELIIPKFDQFKMKCREIFESTRDLEGLRGAVSKWIPQLARVDPNKFAVSVTTVDGQTFSFGDHKDHFAIMDMSTPITYCIAVQEKGLEEVHKYVGREPSGKGSSALKLKQVTDAERKAGIHKANAIPYNPLVTAGGLVCTSMIQEGEPLATRMDSYIDACSALCAKKVGFNPAVMVSERRASDRYNALGYLCKGAKAFPQDDIDLKETLELFFATSSVTASTDMISVAAATLANGGVNPLTEIPVVDPDVARAGLSLMLSCGMHDVSGKWAFDFGLPVKASISGGMMLVVPNVMGIGIYSPCIDEELLPVRGVAFAQRLVDTFAFHHLDSIGGSSDKTTPTAPPHLTAMELSFALIFAASRGDLSALQQCIASGGDVNTCDYDHRTALHLAASEGHCAVVEYLLAQDADPTKRDTRKNTPYDDAMRGKATQPACAAQFEEIANILAEHMQKSRDASPSHRKSQKI
eukprot:m.195034 g.195034  ORF g.195034 m.195034 type:complete len:631 (+) comp19368_c0_seq1:117-2009(+)